MGRGIDEIRSDVEHQRLLTVDDAITYGLIEGRVEPRKPSRAGPHPD